MIGKISIGKSFKGCIFYCIDDKRIERKSIAENDKDPVMKNRAELLSYNLCFGDKYELVKQFNEVRQLNSKLAKPVMHVTLSLAPGDQLEKNKMQQLIEDCAESMGFEKNQFIGVYHKDTIHEHLHIVVNRIGLNGKTLSDSNNFKKIAAFCRQAEQKYKLKEILSPRAFLSKEKKQIPRLDKRLENFKSVIQQSLLSTKDFNGFKNAVESKGIEVITGRGIAFQDDKKVYFKGSDLGYSRATIDKILSYSYQQKEQLKLRMKATARENIYGLSGEENKKISRYRGIR